MPFISTTDIDNEEKKRNPDALRQSWDEQEEARLIPPVRATSPTPAISSSQIMAANPPAPVRAPTMMVPTQNEISMQPNSGMPMIANTPAPQRGQSPLRIVGDIARGVGSAVGQVAAPWAMPFIPGTIQHQMFETGRERQAERFKTEQEKEQAETQAQKARADYEESEAEKSRRGEIPTETPEERAQKFAKYYSGDPNSPEYQGVRGEYILTGKFPTTRASSKLENLDQAEAELFQKQIAAGKDPFETLQSIYDARGAKGKTESPEQQVIDAENVLANKDATPEQKAAAQGTIDSVTAAQKTLHPERPETNELGLWLKEHPGKSVEDYMRFQSGLKDEGSWDLQEEPGTGKSVWVNKKSRQIMPAEGVVPRGTAARERADFEKNVAPVQEAKDYADGYLARNKFTGPGDEALMMKAASVAKAAGGMGAAVKPQLDLLEHSRSIFEGIGARARHAMNPEAPWLDDTQRKNIVGAIDDLATAHMKSFGKPPGAEAGSTVKLISPTGQTKEVPANQVEHYISLGAKRAE